MVTALPIGDASRPSCAAGPTSPAAERRLAAETARTGVATADLFPRVSVTGFIGLLSGDIAVPVRVGRPAPGRSRRR